MVVNPNGSRIMYLAFKRAGGKPKLTQYIGAEFSCWVINFLKIQAYLNGYLPDIYHE